MSDMSDCMHVCMHACVCIYNGSPNIMPDFTASCVDKGFKVTELSSLCKV